MVDPDRLVPVGHCCLIAEKQRSIVPQSVEIPVRVGGLYLEVLGSEPVRDFHYLVLVATDNNFTKVVPGLPGDICGRPLLQPPLDSIDCLLPEFFGSRNQDRRRAWPMLSL